MKDKMEYMVVIKPDGRTLISVLSRGDGECSRIENLGVNLGEVLNTEVIPDSDCLVDITNTLDTTGEDE